ncbi:MAG: ABC transporter ATP-binding protein [Oscillospiraceae bacterium]|nr:ABC transporter ATP-binding protein [Oscillospiraceae bacterium]
MNALEIRSLQKHRKGFSLDGINLTLPAGCIMGLIGENGAGKTTTIKLMLDMIRKDGGTVRILGKDSAEISKEDIGVVLDEVGLPTCLTACQVDKIMSKAYTQWSSDEFFAYLKRLNVPENKAFSALSRGMKMKLGIACALSHKAKLLILDEATSGLDPAVRDEVIDILLDFTRDEEHSVLISSHIVSDLEKICDYIAFMHKGRLMLCEEKDRLYEQYGIIRCDEKTLSAIEPSAVIGKRVSAFGVEAIVRRDTVPEGVSIAPVGIEELFIFMVKEAA